jgi:pathogenesis-related protein 1
MLKLILITFTLAPALLFGQGTIDTTGSQISPQDARAMLDYHNKVRNDQHIAPLTWSSQLAAYAQDWADSLANTYHCKLIHRAGVGKNYFGYGENLYQGRSSTTVNPLNAALAWYDEIQNYHYGKLDESNWFKTGHYTQMVWKSTVEMGVGIATCPGGSVIVVANYNPPGNYMGQYPY